MGPASCFMCRSLHSVLGRLPDTRRMPLFPMEHKYALFVAFATLQAYEQLQLLLSKWKAEVSPEIIHDAAKFGQQRAMDKIYPGLVRIPYQQSPLIDISNALRLQYDMALDETAQLRRHMAADPSSRQSLDAIALPTPVTVSAASRGESSSHAGRISGVPRFDSNAASARSATPAPSARAAVATPPPGGDPDTVRIQPTKLRTVGASTFPWERKKAPGETP